MEPEKNALPTVGRIVHFSMHIGRPDVYPATTYPALVLPTTDGKVDLKVFTHNNDRVVRDVPYSEKAKVDHWSWPPKV